MSNGETPERTDQPAEGSSKPEISSREILKKNISGFILGFVGWLAVGGLLDAIVFNESNKNTLGIGYVMIVFEAVGVYVVASLVVLIILVRKKKSAALGMLTAIVGSVIFIDPFQ